MNRFFYAFWMLAGVIFGNILLPIPSPAQEMATGTTRGELTVNAQTFPLCYAYAADKDNTADIRSLADVHMKKGILLVLADRPIPLEAAWSAFRLRVLAEDGKLNAISLEFDAKGKMQTGQLYYGKAEGKHPGSLVGFNNPPASFDPIYAFKGLKIDSNTISGTAWMPKIENYVGFKNEQIFYQYKAEFAVRIAHLPPVTNILTGNTARSSPQMQAVLTMNEAGFKGDIDAFQRLLTPEMHREFDVLIEQQGKEKVLSLLKAMLADRQATLKHLSRIVVRGNRATVIYDGKDFITSQRLQKVNGIWLGCSQ